MKKKLILLTIAVLGVASFGFSQAANQECLTNLSIYTEYVKTKNYDAAYEPWKKVYEACPKINRANFVYGERILKHKIKNAAAGAEKDGFITDYITLEDNYLKYFPGKAKFADCKIKQCMMQYDNKKVTMDVIYADLDAAFKKDRKNFKNPKAIYLYFSSLVDLHNEGKKELQEVFDVYDEVTNKIEEENNKLTATITKLLPKEEAETLTTKEKKILKNANINSRSYGKIASSIDSKLGALADCSNLIPLYKKSFDAKKGDVKWVKNAVGRMFNKECTDDPLFIKLFEAQLALDPSAKAYMYGGHIKLKAGDSKGAIADFNKAVELETDPIRKSNILYKIATTYRRGSKSTCRNYAQKAINANASNGKAYLLIASLYAGSANSCGTSAFEKRAIYWKAADIAKKAGRVDPSLSSRAARSVKSYLAKAPTKEMIFNANMAGKSVSFKCWVGGSVKVPNL